MKTARFLLFFFIISLIIFLFLIDGKIVDFGKFGNGMTIVGHFIAIIGIFLVWAHMKINRNIHLSSKNSDDYDEPFLSDDNY